MKRSGEIETFLKNMYDLMRAGDGEAAARLIADGTDVLFVGTDADEWWNSSDAAQGAFREQLEATGGFDIEPGELRGYDDGEIGWFDDQPKMRMPDGTIVPLRLTGVARRSNGGWTLVQGHLSVAASINESLFG
jgi:hypothetical protein